VRSAEDKLDEAAENMKDELDKYVDAAKMHNGGEWDLPTMYRPVSKAANQMHLAVIELLDVQDEAKAYGYMSDEAEMERAADQCEISRLGRR
jgi:hypothetical protein